MFDYDTLRDDLREHVMEIVFTKVSDGLNRQMKCTLKRELLPLLTEEQYKILTKKKHSAEDKEVLTVWDLHANGNKGDWRSFRVDHIVSSQILDHF